MKRNSKVVPPPAAGIVLRRAIPELPGFADLSLGADLSTETDESGEAWFELEED